MRKLIARFLRDESGTTAIEYGLIASLIFLVILTAVGATGDGVGYLFNKAMNAISAALG